jgi:hypothetical protein
MFRSAPPQGEGVISPRSLPPTKSLFVEIIDIEDDILPIVCIFEDYEND